MGFALVWDPTVTSDGFSGFAQRRFPVTSQLFSYMPSYPDSKYFQNGSFAFSPPNACSPVDPVGHSCARGTDNNVGFYECVLLSCLFQSSVSHQHDCSFILGNELLCSAFHVYRCRADGWDGYIRKASVRIPLFLSMLSTLIQLAAIVISRVAISKQVTNHPLLSRGHITMPVGPT